MKFFFLSTLHPAHFWNYWKRFYQRHPGLIAKSYAEQKAVWDYEAIGWADFYSHAMTPFGYEVMESYGNIEPLQKTWAAENGIRFRKDMWLQEIAIAQIRKYSPEVLLVEDYSNFNEQWLIELRTECPSIQLVMGYIDSSFPEHGSWMHSDLIISSAPEATELLRKRGHKVEQLLYGFDPRVLQRVHRSQQRIDISFVGQIIRHSKYHTKREEMLEKLVDEVDIQIFSPSEDFGFLDNLEYDVRRTLYDLTQFLRRVGVGENVIKSLPVLKNSLRWQERPKRPVNRKLVPVLKPAVYGLEMFQTLLDSNVTLNIHIDRSSRYASNYRLFEATGIGTCLITDWRENLQELFEPEREVVTYQSVEECAEKIRWLLDHPSERETIAAAGQSRTLQDHTFSNRAAQLHEVIRKALS